MTKGIKIEDLNTFNRKTNTLVEDLAELHNQIYMHMTDIRLYKMIEDKIHLFNRVHRVEIQQTVEKQIKTINEQPEGHLIFEMKDQTVNFYIGLKLTPGINASIINNLDMGYINLKTYKKYLYLIL